MASSLRLGIPAVLLTAALVGGSFSTALADDEPVADPAVLSFSGDPSVLTLPAGDGVRDTTTVTLTSTAPATAELAVVSVDRATQYAELAPVEFTDETLSQEIEVPVTGLVAGTLLLEATVAGEEDAVSIPLTVGSGEPSRIALTLSRSVIYTWAKSSARTTTATVSAKDETGLNVPFRGSVIAKTGGVSRSVAVASAKGAAATAAFSSGALRVGAGTVVATLRGPSTTTHTSAAARLTVTTVAVTGAKLSASVSSIYPAKDGYRDSARISLATSTTTGGVIPVTGTVKLTKGKKTIKTWKITSSKAWSTTWNGKVKGKTVYGTYKLTATVKGPQGAAKKTTATIKVVKGKLVTKTKTVTTTSGAVLSSYLAFDEWQLGYCDRYSGGVVSCSGYEPYYDDSISVMAFGGLTVPSEVVNAQKYGGAKVRVSLTASSVYGWAAWGYSRPDGVGFRATTMKQGTTNAGWLALPATTRRVEVTAGLGEYSFFYAGKVKVEFSYKVLKK